MNACRQGTWALLLALFALAAGPAQAQTVVEYIHTDGLGSVVAVTDANRTVIERREYEPFGAQLTPAVQDGPGYTGHVQDAATGLVYMQQRYYDPAIGGFLSVDPVSMDTTTAWNFCRYCYANNNPYKFTDPDGRRSRPVPANFNVNTNAIARARAAPTVRAVQEEVRGVTQQVAQDFDDGRGTLQIGVAVNGTAGPLAGTTEAGVVVDRQGNVAVYTETGAGMGTGAGAVGGVSLKVTNAESVADLGGVSANVSAGGGNAAHGTVDVMTARAADGSKVYGVGATIGAGAGGGGSATISETNVSPVLNFDEKKIDQ